MGERFAKLGYECFGAVVYWLIDWHIDDVCAHAGGYDEAAAALSFEDLANVFGAIYDAVH